MLRYFNVAQQISFVLDCFTHVAVLSVIGVGVETSNEIHVAAIQSALYIWWYWLIFED